MFDVMLGYFIIKFRVFYDAIVILYLMSTYSNTSMFIKWSYDLW